MATIRLVPSTIYNSASSYLTISSESNAYTNTDSTTYATISNTNASTSNRYVYIRGFNFDDVPSNAIVSAFTIKVKGYYTDGYSQAISVCNGTTAISGPSATSLSTSVATRTFTNSTLTWDTMSGYGSNFGIRINCRRNSRNTAATYYIYGAEIEVTYTLPVYHTVTSSGDGTLDPTGQMSLLEGSDYTLRISGLSAKPTVTDNNVDVTSSVTEVTVATETAIPGSNTNSGWYSVTDIANAYTDANSTTMATLQLAGRATGTIYLDLSGLSIPSGATITSISCDATLQYGRNGSSSGFSSSCQLYSNNTAKGSSYSWVTAGGTDVAKTTFHLTTGTWTASELANARLYLTATNSASNTRRYVYIYGVSLNVTYESDGVTYVYTITNVTADHTIVVSAAASTKIWIKLESSDTLLGSKSNSNTDSSLNAFTFSNGEIVSGDTIAFVYDVNAYYSGSQRGSESGTIEFTWDGTQQTYTGTNVSIQITPVGSTVYLGFYRAFGYSCTYTGSCSVYKQSSGGGWTAATKVYKKVNGSWVEQSNLTSVFVSGTNYVKG